MDTDLMRSCVAIFHKRASGAFRLFSVVVEDDEGRTQYDVDLSRAYGYVFHQSGSGGCDPIIVEGPYHVSGGSKVKERPCLLVDRHDEPPWRGDRTKAIRARNRTRRLRAVPKAFDLGAGEDILDWLQREAIEQQSVYCTICSDVFPEDSVCEHIWWCERDGLWSTPDDRGRCACTGANAWRCDGSLLHLVPDASLCQRDMRGLWMHLQV